MFKEYICIEYPSLKNIYLYLTSMFKECICTEYPCLNNISILGIHV